MALNQEIYDHGDSQMACTELQHFARRLIQDQPMLGVQQDEPAFVAVKPKPGFMRQFGSAQVVD
jgi:hypothetical protein